MSDPQVENTAFVERTQDHLNHYIAAADRKASIHLTGLLAFLGLYGNAVRSAFEQPPQLFVIFTSLAILSALVASLFSLSVIYPRTHEPQGGYLLWSSILETGKKGYREEMQNLEPETAFQNLVNANFALASVADRKYKSLQRSFTCTFIMLGFVLASYTFAVL